MTVLTQEGHAEDFNSRELEEEKLQRQCQRKQTAEGGDPLAESGSTPLEGPLMRNGSKEGVPCHHHSGTQKGTPPELPTDTQRPC